MIVFFLCDFHSDCLWTQTVMGFTARLALFTIFLLAPTLAYSSSKCRQYLCAHGQVCCANRNSTDVSSFYSTIAVVTRKLSGVLIMLLLFAMGYFFQRILCSRSRQHPPPQNGSPPVTTSQELLMESCAPDSLDYPAPRLPTYDECKLPTYEETVGDGSRERAVSAVGLAT